MTTNSFQHTENNLVLVCSIQEFGLNDEPISLSDDPRKELNINFQKQPKISLSKINLGVYLFLTLTSTHYKTLNSDRCLRKVCRLIFVE